MISPRKLASLPRKTRLRKIVTLIEEWGRLLDTGKPLNMSYVREVLALLCEEKRVEERVRLLSQELLRHEEHEERESLRRSLEHLQFALMESLGLSPADWDFYDPHTSEMTREKAQLFPLRVYLDDIRSPFNVGSIFRTAEAFGAEKVFVSQYSARPDHKRALRTSMGCTDILPWKVCAVEELERGEAGEVFALETGGTPIDEFSFPAEGTVVVGSEELGISPEMRSRAGREAGIVSIPLSGAKASLNVAVAFGILMQRWRSSLAGSADLGSTGT